MPPDFHAPFPPPSQPELVAQRLIELHENADEAPRGSDGLVRPCMSMLARAAQYQSVHAWTTELLAKGNYQTKHLYKADHAWKSSNDRFSIRDFPKFTCRYLAEGKGYGEFVKHIYGSLNLRQIAQNPGKPYGPFLIERPVQIVDVEEDDERSGSITKKVIATRKIKPFEVLGMYEGEQLFQCEHINDVRLDPFSKTTPNAGKPKNVVVMEAIILGWPYFFVVSVASIKPGEELLMDYGPQYWEVMRGFKVDIDLIDKELNPLSRMMATMEETSFIEKVVSAHESVQSKIERFSENMNQFADQGPMIESLHRKVDALPDQFLALAGPGADSQKIVPLLLELKENIAKVDLDGKEKREALVFWAFDFLSSFTVFGDMLKYLTAILEKCYELKTARWVLEDLHDEGSKAFEQWINACETAATLTLKLVDCDVSEDLLNGKSVMDLFELRRKKEMKDAETMTDLYDDELDLAYPFKLTKLSPRKRIPAVKNQHLGPESLSPTSSSADIFTTPFSSIPALNAAVEQPVKPDPFSPSNVTSPVPIKSQASPVQMLDLPASWESGASSPLVRPKRRLRVQMDEDEMDEDESEEKMSDIVGSNKEVDDEDDDDDSVDSDYSDAEYFTLPKKLAQSKSGLKSRSGSLAANISASESEKGENKEDAMDVDSVKDDVAKQVRKEIDAAALSEDGWESAAENVKFPDAPEPKASLKENVDPGDQYSDSDDNASTSSSSPAKSPKPVSIKAQLNPNRTFRSYGGRRRMVARKSTSFVPRRRTVERNSDDSESSSEEEDSKVEASPDGRVTVGGVTAKRKDDSYQCPNCDYRNAWPMNMTSHLFQAHGIIKNSNELAKDEIILKTEVGLPKVEPTVPPPAHHVESTERNAFDVLMQSASSSSSTPKKGGTKTQSAKNTPTSKAAETPVSKRTSSALFEDAEEWTPSKKRKGSLNSSASEVEPRSPSKRRKAWKSGSSLDTDHRIGLDGTVVPQTATRPGSPVTAPPQTLQNRTTVTPSTLRKASESARSNRRDGSPIVKKKAESATTGTSRKAMFPDISSLADPMEPSESSKLVDNHISAEEGMPALLWISSSTSKKTSSANDSTNASGSFALPLNTATSSLQMESMSASGSSSNIATVWSKQPSISKVQDAKGSPTPANQSKPAIKSQNHSCTPQMASTLSAPSSVSAPQPSSSSTQEAQLKPQSLTAETQKASLSSILDTNEGSNSQVANSSVLPLTGFNIQLGSSKSNPPISDFPSRISELDSCIDKLKSTTTPTAQNFSSAHSTPFSSAASQSGVSALSAPPTELSESMKTESSLLDNTLVIPNPRVSRKRSSTAQKKKLSASPSIGISSESYPTPNPIPQLLVTETVSNSLSAPLVSTPQPPDSKKASNAPTMSTPLPPVSGTTSKSVSTPSTLAPPSLPKSVDAVVGAVDMAKSAVKPSGLNPTLSPLPSAGTSGGFAGGSDQRVAAPYLSPSKEMGKVSKTQGSSATALQSTSSFLPPRLQRVASVTSGSVVQGSKNGLSSLASAELNQQTSSPHAPRAINVSSTLEPVLIDLTDEPSVGTPSNPIVIDDSDDDVVARRPIFHIRDVVSVDGGRADASHLSSNRSTSSSKPKKKKQKRQAAGIVS
ncbi:hypothetical protein HDV05_003016 [Chytridiales sp. JEL 0842]|nr:hypothetical protein HDV05_003016 [Chytridiales sp. JEL 0842]